MSCDKKSESREMFQRRLSSLGAHLGFTQQKSSNHFETLKQNRMKLMGKVLRNSQSEVDFFSLRDHNAKRKSIQEVSQEPQFLFSDSVVEQEQLQVSLVECSKCQTSLSKVVVQWPAHKPQLELKKPILERSVERQSRRQLEQVHLSPHHPLSRNNLPPILFQAHLKQPDGVPQPKSGSQRKEAHSIPGRIQFGRIAEGIDEEYLEFLLKQKLLQQSKLKPQNSKKKYSLKKVNLLKSKTSGNILGKAISKMKSGDFEAEEEQKRLEKQMIREKERQIDELIFSKKNNNNTEEFLEMKDFL